MPHINSIKRLSPELITIWHNMHTHTHTYIYSSKLNIEVFICCFKIRNPTVPSPTSKYRMSTLLLPDLVPQSHEAISSYQVIQMFLHPVLEALKVNILDVHIQLHPKLQSCKVKHHIHNQRKEKNAKHRTMVFAIYSNPIQTELQVGTLSIPRPNPKIWPIMKVINFTPSL